ncbi:transcriptional-regulating factor 1-like isoform X2 [Cyprinodon tularosa]|uniref:transcriptional-regulating factor 1-like isoform X2 n=1 Tax=Cyprinodon tularosa TaxID=77115 RepID=UPI0018E24CAE|nr:transcriptional-regulating factor 1-like isoform X2 [Cyprinodon tularosa]
MSRPERGRTCDHFLTTRKHSKPDSHTMSRSQSVEVGDVSDVSSGHAALCAHENMSDLWTFPAASPPSIVQQSSRSHSLPPFSTSLFRSHGSPSPAKVTSPIYSPQNTPPVMCQVSSPNLGLRTQASSFQFPQSQITSTHQITSPHLSPHMEVSPSQLFYPSQITSPHLPSAPVSSSYHLGSPQVASPHLHPQPQHFLYNQNPDPELDYVDWDKCEESSDLSCYLNGSGFSYQNGSPSPLDIHLQNQYSTSDPPCTDEVERTAKAYNTHSVHAGGVFEHSDPAGQAQHAWDSMSPTLSQVQCPPLGSGNPMGRWSSSPAEDFPTNQFYHESYHGNIPQQPFCSPTTPGPSPHYPQTPTVSSPSPQMHPRTDRTGCPKQASKQLSRDASSALSLNDHGAYFPSSEKTPHQRTQRHLQSQSPAAEEATACQHETSFSAQERGPPSSGSTGRGCKEEGRGGRRGPRKAAERQTDWNWVKQLQPLRTSGVLDSRCRLLCTVCNRDFKSLPALNGHMRSHSGFRSPTRIKKDTSPPTQSPMSLVMPVSVPVQTRGQKKGCVSTPASGGAVLYRSLMHEEDAAPAGHKAGDNVTMANLHHYTPPPMLCPERAGSGLYCSLTTGRQQRAETIQLHNELADPVSMVTADPPPELLASGNFKPRINFGKNFQAEIPPLRDSKHAQGDSHNALLLWTPYEELEHPVNQQRVEALLLLARSSVVPGAQASPEYALQLLSECKGDFLLTLEKLMNPETSSNHTGVWWSAAEKKLLVKSLQIHRKDFSSIQKSVRSKSLSECVEYYYLWKKKLSLGVKTPTDLTVSLPGANGQKVLKSQKAS